MNRACFGSHEALLRGDHTMVTETRHRSLLRTPAHDHEVSCLHYVVDGVYEESTRDGTHRLEPGWFLFKPAGEVHWNEFHAGGARTLRVELEPDAVPGLARNLPAKLTVLRSPLLSDLALRIRSELAAVDDLSATMTEALAIEILAGVARQANRRTAGERDLAADCARYLDERFRDRVALADAADALGVDRTVLARAFRRETGRTVGEYIRVRRVSYVAEALRDGDRRSLAELALAAGFADQSHLSRCFHRILGMPPGSWRRRLRSR